MIPHCNYKILAFDATEIINYHNLKNTDDYIGYCFKKDNYEKIKRDFSGCIYSNLDTVYLEDKKYLYTHGPDSNVFQINQEKYTTAFVVVSFKKRIKPFYKLKVKNGYAYIKFGYLCEKGELRPGAGLDYEELIKNHIIVKDGELLAVHVPFIEKGKKDEKPKISKDHYAPLSEESIKKWNSVNKADLPRRKNKEGKDVFYIRKENYDGKEYFAVDDYVIQNNQYVVKNKTILKKNNNDKKFELREKLYIDGFYVNNKHYRRYARSAGSARDGKILFIEDSVYDKIKDWRECGIDSPKRRKDPVAWEAYSALSLSSLMRNKDNQPYLVKIPKKSILIIPDAKAPKCVAEGKGIKDENGHLVTTDVVNDSSEWNTIWDGECLLDVSVFDDANLSDKGMMLLRNSFFKSCGFKTNIQKWFEKNKINRPSQLSGFAYPRPRKLSDIKMIVCPSSIKFLKFFEFPDDTILNTDAIDKWLEIIDKRPFGILKTEKKTGYFDGRMVRTNYQFINTLELTDDSVVQRLLKDSKEYLKEIQNDPIVMAYYLSLARNELTDLNDESEDDDEKNGEPDNEDNEDSNGFQDNSEPDIDAFQKSDYSRITANYKNNTVFSMLKANAEFFNTELCRKFKNDLTKDYKNTIKKGKILVSGTNATLFGNGYEFLEALLKKNENDRWRIDFINGKKELVFTTPSKLALEGERIYVSRFKDGEQVVCARNPHITMGNLLKTENKKCEVFQEYFGLSDEIACVNSIKNSLLDRLNGADFDSDFFLITNDRTICDAAKPQAVPICLVNPESKDDSELHVIDYEISNNKIGEIVNLSQFLNSMWWTYNNFNDEENNKKLTEIIENSENLYDDICILAVLSGMEIDRAKREYPINVANTIEEIRKKYKDKYLKNYSVPKWYKIVVENPKRKKIDNKDQKKDNSQVNNQENMPENNQENNQKSTKTDIVDICSCPMSTIWNEIEKWKGKKGKKNRTLAELCEVKNIEYAPSEKIIKEIADITSETDTNWKRQHSIFKDAAYSEILDSLKQILEPYYTSMRNLIKEQDIFETIILLVENGNGCNFVKEEYCKKIYSNRWLVLSSLVYEEENSDYHSVLLERMKKNAKTVQSLIICSENEKPDYLIMGNPMKKV